MQSTDKWVQTDKLDCADKSAQTDFAIDEVVYSKLTKTIGIQCESRHIRHRGGWGFANCSSSIYQIIDGSFYTLMNLYTNILIRPIKRYFYFRWFWSINGCIARG